MGYMPHDLDLRRALLSELAWELTELHIPWRRSCWYDYSIYCSDAFADAARMRWTGPALRLGGGGELGHVRVCHDPGGVWFWLWPDEMIFPDEGWPPHPGPHRHDHAGHLAGRIAVVAAETPTPVAGARSLAAGRRLPTGDAAAATAARWR